MIQPHTTTDAGALADRIKNATHGSYYPNADEWQIIDVALRKSALQETRGDEPVAWQARDKVHGGAWFHATYPHGNPDGFEYRPLYAVSQQPPRLEREALIEECAKLADKRASDENLIFERAADDVALSDTGRVAIQDCALARRNMARAIGVAIRALLSSNTTERS